MFAREGGAQGYPGDGARNLRVLSLYYVSIQPDMAVLFCYLVKCDASVRYCKVVYTGQWISRVLQGTRNTRPRITGHPVFISASCRGLNIPMMNHLTRALADNSWSQN